MIKKHLPDYSMPRRTLQVGCSTSEICDKNKKKRHCFKDGK